MNKKRRTLSDHLSRHNWQTHARLPSCFFITDLAAVPDPAAVIAALPAGAGVLIRDYDHADRYEYAAEILSLCQYQGVMCFLACQKEADWHWAQRMGADGVHLPEGLMNKINIIRRRSSQLMITVACHSQRALNRAANLGADACFLSPVFPTLSHSDTLKRKDKTLGPCRLRMMVGQTNVPVYALGGITTNNIIQLQDTGIAGIAAIRGFQK